MCLSHACAVQITSGTDRMEHEMAAKVFRKGTQMHQESMTRTSPRKDIGKSGPCLEVIRNACSKRYPKELFYFGILLLGASSGSFGAPIEFVMQKVSPKSSQNDHQIAKVTPKDTPRTQKCIKSDAGF